MRRLLVLTMACAAVCFGQTTSGACSPVIQSGAHVTGFTLTCKGMSDAEGKQLLEILNQIAKNQVDPKLVMTKLDEIIKAQHMTSEDVSKGVQQGIEAEMQKANAQAQQVQQQLNNPKKVATDSYQRLSDYLDMSRRNAAQVGSVGVPTGTDRVMQSYQMRYAALIHSLLERRARAGSPVGDLVTLSENVKSTDDIRKIADGLQKIDRDPLAKSYAYQLTNLLSLSGGGFNAAGYMETQTVNNYLNTYRRLMSNNLENLKNQHIPVDDLIELNQNIKTTADIQKLADGFKRIADSLPQ